MTPLKLAQTIKDFMAEGRDLDLYDEIYAFDAVSVEPIDFGVGREFHGRAAIREKKKWIMENFVKNELSVEGPYSHGVDRFIMIYRADTTDAMLDARDTVTVLGLYLVESGQIVREEFFF